MHYSLVVEAAANAASNTRQPADVGKVRDAVVLANTPERPQTVSEINVQQPGDTPD